MVDFSCSTTAKMFPSLPPPEWVVPIVGDICTSQGYPHDVHHFGFRTVLLSVRTTHGFGGLLHWPGISIGWTHYLFCSLLHERSFKFLDCKLKYTIRAKHCLYYSFYYCKCKLITRQEKRAAVGLTSLSGGLPPSWETPGKQQIP